MKMRNKEIADCGVRIADYPNVDCGMRNGEGQMSNVQCPMFTGVRRLAGGLVLMLALAGAARGGEVSVRTAAEAKRAMARTAAGDAVVFEDGRYDLGQVKLSRRGTEEKPIVIRARNVGKATLAGKTAFVFEKAAYITLEGFEIAPTDVTPIDIRGSHHIRITRDTIHVEQRGPTKAQIKYVYIRGSANGLVNSHHTRVDHCVLEDKHVLGAVVAIGGLEGPTYACSQYDRIDHNLFRRIGPRVANGLEAIRAGLAEMSLSSGFTTIENNLFEACDGDPEIISVKNCDSVVRGNTFRRCQGGVCLRHGNRNTVEGNFFFGEGGKGTCGVRAYGDDHRIVNNYLEGLSGPALQVDAGDRDYPSPVTEKDRRKTLNRHLRPRRITLAFNTLVDCAAPFKLGAASGEKAGAVLPAQDVRIANNLVSGWAKRMVEAKGAIEDLEWLGNIVWGGEQEKGSERDGLGIKAKEAEVRVVDTGLKREGELWRLQAGDPALGAAQGKFENVIRDMDGQARRAPLDVGADQKSSEPVINKPLRESDVGPK